MDKIICENCKGKLELETTVLPAKGKTTDVWVALGCPHCKTREIVAHTIIDSKGKARIVEEVK